jgi:putative photosynthetic complex assembly protein
MSGPAPHPSTPGDTAARPRAVIPPGLVVGAGLLLAVTIGFAGVTRLTHKNHVTLDPTYAVAERDLTFTDQPDGGVRIEEAGTGRLISTVPPRSGGFLRGILRGLVHDHRREANVPFTAFRLTRWADGRLSIEDPATQESFELEAFGSTNEKVFAQLLTAPAQ